MLNAEQKRQFLSDLQNATSEQFRFWFYDKRQRRKERCYSFHGKCYSFHGRCYPGHRFSSTPGLSSVRDSDESVGKSDNPLAPNLVSGTPTSPLAPPNLGSPTTPYGPPTMPVAPSTMPVAPSTLPVLGATGGCGK